MKLSDQDKIKLNNELHLKFFQNLSKPNRKGVKCELTSYEIKFYLWVACILPGG